MPILVLSAAVRRGSEQAAEALAAGALEALPKTQVRLDDPDGPAAVALRHRLRRLARTAAPAGTRRASPSFRRPPELPDGRHRGRRSAPPPAGPRALEAVLRACRPTSRCPCSSSSTWRRGFMDGLIRWLDAARPASRGRGQRTGSAPGRASGFPRTTRTCCWSPSMRLALDRETVVGRAPSLGRRAARERGRVGRRGRGRGRAHRHGARRRRAASRPSAAAAAA